MKTTKRRDLFAAVFEHNPTKTIVVDREGRIVAINKAKRESNDRLPEIGMIMYVNYANEHTIDMRAELMACMEKQEMQYFPERVYGERIMSITITPFSEGAVIITEDITEHKKMEKALKQSEERFRILFEKIPGIAVQVYGLNGEVKLWNQASTELYGYTAEEVIGQSLYDLIIPSDMRSDVEVGIQWMMDTGKSLPSAELVLKRKDGSLVQVFSSHALIKMPESDPEFFCVDIDITERKVAERALQKSEELLRAITDAAQDAIIMMDSQGCISFWNPAAEHIFGYMCDEVIGKPLHEHIAPEKFREKYCTGIEHFLKSGKGPTIGKITDYEALCKDGRVITAQISLAPIVMDGGWCAVGVLRDVTECKIREEELRASEKRFRELSMTDSLTHLYNRRYFFLELDQEIKQAERYKQALSILMCDMDHFKRINDTYGHAEGDYVLEMFSHIFKSVLRETDIPCRYGGEEFIAILPMTTRESLLPIAERLRCKVGEMLLPFAPEERITISSGIAQYQLGEGLDMFLRRVDDLLLQAKNNGRNCICA